jgi:hypothetical protein
MLTQDALKYGVHKSQQKPGDKEIDFIERGKLIHYVDGTTRVLNDNPGMMEKEAKPVIDTADKEGAVIVKIDLEDMKHQELKKYAKSKGIKFSRSDSKEDLIKLIKAAN